MQILSMALTTVFIIIAALHVYWVFGFKYAGFFKGIKENNFAKYDNWLYSPFCLISGGALLFLSINLT